MATEILMDLAKAAGGDLLQQAIDDVKGRKYGEASEAVEAILSAQKQATESIIHKVQEVAVQSKLDEEFNQIGKIWGEALKDRLSKANKGNPKPLEELHGELNDTTEGIHKRLITIDSVLRGSASEYSSEGAIKLYMKKSHQDLDSDNMDYTLEHWMNEIARYLKAHFHLQNLGLVLRIAAADDMDDTGKWQRDMKATLQSQIDYAWRNFPAMVRKIKSGFTSPAVPASHWWRFRERDGGRKFLERDVTFWAFTKDFDMGTDGPNPKSEWRFNKALDSKGLVQIQSRTDKNWWVVKVETDSTSNPGPYGGGFSPGSARFELSAREENREGHRRNRAGFKIVPQFDCQEPYFRFRADGSWRDRYPFDKVWELCDDGVGQWE